MALHDPTASTLASLRKNVVVMADTAHQEGTSETTYLLVEIGADGSQTPLRRITAEEMGWISRGISPMAAEHLKLQREKAMRDVMLSASRRAASLATCFLSAGGPTRGYEANDKRQHKRTADNPRRGRNERCPKCGLKNKKCRGH